MTIRDMAMCIAADRTYLRMLAGLQAEADDELQLGKGQLCGGIVQAGLQQHEALCHLQYCRTVSRVSLILSSPVFSFDEASQSWTRIKQDSQIQIPNKCIQSHSSHAFKRK